MKRSIKSRKFVIFVLCCLIASTLLIIFNFSQFQRYRINQRNKERKEQVSVILKSIKDYMKNNNNNLPTSSNPEEGSFLPELLNVLSNKPAGGVAVQTLENMKGYFDQNKKDPSGEPYFIGTYKDKVIVYTNSFENENKSKTVYFDSFDINSAETAK